MKVEQRDDQVCILGVYLLVHRSVIARTYMMRGLTGVTSLGAISVYSAIDGADMRYFLPLSVEIASRTLHPIMLSILTCPFGVGTVLPATKGFERMETGSLCVTSSRIMTSPSVLSQSSEFSSVKHVEVYLGRRARWT